MGQPAAVPWGAELAAGRFALCMLSTWPGCSMPHAHGSRPPCPGWAQAGEHPRPNPELAPDSHLLSGRPDSAPCFTPFSFAFTPNHLSFWSQPLTCPGFANWRHHPHVVPHSNLLHICDQGLSGEQSGEAVLGSPLPQCQLDHGGLSPTSRGPPRLTADRLCPVDLTHPGRCQHH